MEEGGKSYTFVVVSLGATRRVWSRSLWSWRVATCSDRQAPSKGSMDSSSEESSEGPSAESSPASSDEL